MTKTVSPALELVAIDKHFGTVHANRAVSLSVAPGSIHGIVGENGAGKSTLMNVVFGFHQASSGEILVDGKAVAIHRPEDAIRAGIGMVHQHFMLVERMTVLENVVLGTVGAGPLKSQMEDARRRLDALARETGFAAPLDAVVGDLPVGTQQQIEILKALDRGARILILDEPTAVLTPQETDALFVSLRAMRDAGRTVILITHKLGEIMRLTDRVTVMRQGAVVGEVATADSSEARLAEMMVGRPVLLRVDKQPASPGELLLQVQNLTVGRGLQDVSLHIRRGEIVGIAGVAGNGQSELLEALAGMVASTGTIEWKGAPLTPVQSSPSALRRLGIAHVPENRLKHALVAGFAAAETAILGRHHAQKLKRGLLLSRRALTAACAQMMQRFDVRPPDPRWPTAGFSGGNQQKLVLARELEPAPDLLLIGQPTRGVDVGAIEFIYRQLIALRDRGGAVLLVSSELDQLVSLSDRILVLSGGRLIGEVAPEDASEETLGLMMGGVTVQAAAA
jgi:simple sugar transport system ATP-binding protein